MPSHIPDALQAPAQSHSSSVTLGKEFYRLMPQFPHLYASNDEELSSIREDRRGTWLVSTELPPGLSDGLAAPASPRQLLGLQESVHFANTDYVPTVC